MGARGERRGVARTGCCPVCLPMTEQRLSWQAGRHAEAIDSAEGKRVLLCSTLWRLQACWERPRIVQA